MNKKQQELLDKCVRVNVRDDIPLLDGILIIQQRRLHDSGYRMMYVIGQIFEDDKYYLLSTYSDVIDIGNMFSNPAHYDVHLDINSNGIIRIWSNGKKFKSTFRVSSCCFDVF